MHLSRWSLVLEIWSPMHDEEETDTSTGTIEEMQPSLLPAVGETIAPIGGTLVDVKDVPKIHLIQGLHILSSHII